MSGPSPALLASISSTLRRPSTPYLVPTLVAATLGQGGPWASQIYQHAVSQLPQSPPTRSHSPLPAHDPVPRRIVLRQMKEALVKASILIGVPKVIESLLELGEVVEEGARDDSFVREGLGKGQSVEGSHGWGRDEVERRGLNGIGRIYRDDIDGIWKKMGSDMLDIKMISKEVTYGTFLTPHQGPEGEDMSLSPDPLAHDPCLLSYVTLSCLIPQRTPREILWHIRGALRNGLPRSEVEILQSTVEELCEVLGVKNVGKGMPRVADIELQEGEGTRSIGM
ncbi:hypothetical protein T439DRAFT_224838 [Meredithblackwellia eburnea MCA 4105]